MSNDKKKKKIMKGKVNVYYSALKQIKKEIRSYPRIWINPEDSTLSEIGQSQRYKHCVICTYLKYLK